MSLIFQVQSFRASRFLPYFPERKCLRLLAGMVSRGMHALVRSFFGAMLVVCGLFVSTSEAQQAPTGLLVDLMPAGWPGPTSNTPSFSWIVNDDAPDVTQTARRIQICRDAGCEDLVEDTGWIAEQVSTAVAWKGKPLSPGVYFWRVATENNSRRGPFSQSAAFTVGGKVFTVPAPPLVAVREEPIRMVRLTPDRYFFDFGTVSFAALELDVKAAGPVGVLAGELSNGRKQVWRPGDTAVVGGGLEVGSYALSLKPEGGPTPFLVNFAVRNRPAPAQLPAGITGIAPFRFLELSGLSEKPVSGAVTRLSIGVPFDPEASTFLADNPLLNDIYDLCKYTVAATTYAGIYVDGQRERLPYEADAYVNQLAHYAVDREFITARHTLAYFMENATWPTEWVLITPLLALADYRHTGDIRFAQRYFDTLAAKTLAVMAQEDGLLAVNNRPLPRAVLKAIGFSGEKLRDIVDWPPEERADYILAPVNTVVNSFYHASQLAMAELARALGKTKEAREFEEGAKKTATAMRKKLFDTTVGLFRDGQDVSHHSAHATLFPLVYGITPPEYRERAVSFLLEKAMFTSAYAARYLLEALYLTGRDREALALLTSKGPRSWSNMLEKGATVTWEAWDFPYKPNMDLNHAWAASPAEIITTRLMGITPLTPGFSTISIAPRPGTLRRAAITAPTVRGPVRAAFTREPGLSFVLDFSIPANTKAVVRLPRLEGNLGYRILLDDKEISATTTADGHELPLVGSGAHKAQVVAVTKDDAPR